MKLAACLFIITFSSLIFYPSTTSAQSNGDFFAFEWSPDTTKYAVTYINPNTFEIRDTQTNQLIFSRNGTRTQAFAWSNDSAYLAFAHGDTNVVDIIDGSSGDLVTFLEIPEIPLGFIRDVKSLAWSPDGTKIAGITQTGSGLATEIQLRIWDVSTQQPYLTIGKGGASRVIWSPDGNSIAVVVSLPESPNITEVLNPLTGNLLFSIEGIAKGWKPDGSQIVTTDPLKVSIYNGSDGNLIRTIDSSAPSISDVAWTSDETLIASGSWFGYLEVWEAATGEAILTITDLRVVRVAWVPDSNDLLYFVLGETENTIHKVSVPNGVSCDHDPPNSTIN